MTSVSLTVSVEKLKVVIHGRAGVNVAVTLTVKLTLFTTTVPTLKTISLLYPHTLGELFVFSAHV